MSKAIVDLAVLSLDETGRVILSDQDLAVLQKIEAVPLAGGANQDCNGLSNGHCINEGLCNDSINSNVCTNSGQCNRSGNQVCQNDVPPS